jgi:hypothetical protein
VHGISTFISGMDGIRTLQRTSTHDGPDIRTTAMAALPEEVDRAKMVSSEGTISKSF